MKTKIYLKPEVEVLTVNLQSHILDLSVPIGPGPGPGGGGQARREIFENEDSSGKQPGAPSNHNLWED